MAINRLQLAVAAAVWSSAGMVATKFEAFSEPDFQWSGHMPTEPRAAGVDGLADRSLPSLRLRYAVALTR